jgi:hypothetical protein
MGVKSDPSWWWHSICSSLCKLSILTEYELEPTRRPCSLLPSILPALALHELGSPTCCQRLVMWYFCDKKYQL